jgi:malonyl-CoA decarboxylase
MNVSFLSDLLQSIAERGRALLGRRIATPRAASDLGSLCEDLLSRRGEASGVALGQEILVRWSGLDRAGRLGFLLMLCCRFGADRARLAAAIAAYQAEASDATALELHRAAEPRRQEVIRRLNMAPDGIAALVGMRADLLGFQREHPELAALDADFAHLFSSWFNRGFLVLRRIDWATPASVLEKIIRYEAVHEIQSWDELRRRLAPTDRRLYAFFHPQLVDEPLIFVEVALTVEVPATIQSVLADSRDPISPEEATTAVFYSISNAQEGLRGISFGNFLIKQVVEDLRRELPGLTDFFTLSPVPGFAAWLARERRAEAPAHLTPEDREALAALDQAGWPQDSVAAEQVRKLLLPAAAYYLLHVKRPNGMPEDAVARFHLGNGASLERINFLGDPSPNGLRQAHGVMVNYCYSLDRIEENHEAYFERKQVNAASAVRRLLRRRGEARELIPANTTSPSARQAIGGNQES